MPRHALRVSLLTTLLATAACSQPPAQIEFKGSNTYGKNSSYASNIPYNSYSPFSGGKAPYQPAPVYTNIPARPVSLVTEQRASVQSIGVSDLSPPAAKSEARPVAIGDSSRVNPWTNKPRAAEQPDAFNLQPRGKQSEREQMVSEVKLIPADSKGGTVTQLDRVIANDGAKAEPKAIAKAGVSSSGFMWPVNGRKIISSYGPKGGGKANDGINIAAANGEPVWAAADGEVVYTGNELEGYGNMVLIKHAGDKSTSYAHLSRVTVDKYERVKQGDIIGYVGSTGSVKSPQLHFAIRDGKDPVDPMKYVKRDVASR